MGETASGRIGNGAVAREASSSRSVAHSRARPFAHSQIRLVAIDVDGTLLDPAGTIRPRVERSIKAAIAAGCQVVLATGRRLQSAVPLAQRVGITTLILVDGAVVYDLDATHALYERTLSPTLCRLAVNLAWAAELSPILVESPVAGGHIFAGPSKSDNPETARYLERREDVVRVPIEQLAALDHISHVVAMGDQARVQDFTAQTVETGQFSGTFWSPHSAGYTTCAVQLVSPGVSKGSALLWLANHRGIPLDQTLAVGDYENDVSMVETAGVGVAMGNATPSLKAVAQAVVADNEHDGVAEALEQWVLGSEL